MVMSIERVEDGGVNNHEYNLENKLSDGLEEEDSKKSFFAKWGLLLMNVSCSAVGFIGGPLLLRVYFLHGGSRKWLSGWLQTAGFPILLIPLTYLYLRDQWKFKSGSKFFADPLLLACAAVIGLLAGLSSFLYSYGLSCLPLSTSTLILSTQLAFTALFAFVMCKQKLTPYSINTVVLMTLGAILLGITKNGDRPEGVTSSQYLLGFILSIAAALLLGFILPCVEVAYAKTSKAPLNYPIVLQFQFCMSMFASLFCTIGMIVNKDFSAMQREANASDIGATKYYLVLVSSAVVWQLMYVGSLGFTFCVSSLFAGIIAATFLPMTEVAAVIFFSEKFTGEKGLSLALGVWGMASYFYGSYRENKKQQSVNHSASIKLNELK